MKRAIDKPYFTYTAYTATTSGICVKCPKCNGLGMVTTDNNFSYFKCTSCGASKTKERQLYRYDVHNQCKACGRYYRVDITDESKQHFPTLHVAAPIADIGWRAKYIKQRRTFSRTPVRLKMPRNHTSGLNFGF